jgi:allantoate deiminase
MHTPPLDSWDAAGILRRLDQLALCTETPGEITRLFLTPEHQAAIALVSGWMQHAGLTTMLDASATLIGRLPAQRAGAPTLMLGSHIDTVRKAGRYDGCLGVLLAIAAAAQLGRHALPYHLEIRAFGDEEGVRFPVTLTGAHAAAGSFQAEWLETTDATGETLGQALRSFGLNPASLAANTCAGNAFAYLEIHIEQGPVLESQNAPLGIVTAINGAIRMEISVAGQAGHAGTVPMAQRRDALAAAAEMVLAIEAIAHAGAQAGVTATVGRLWVSPDATNVIPGACVFTLDLRAPTDALRDQTTADTLASLQAIAAARGVGLSHRQTHAAAAAACDARLQSALADTLQTMNLPVIRLPSGAGHDAMVMARHCPVGMLFVRCRGGISHHPDEYVTEADVALALDATTATLRAVAPGEFPMG